MHAGALLLLFLLRKSTQSDLAETNPTFSFNLILFLEESYLDLIHSGRNKYLLSLGILFIYVVLRKCLLYVLLL